MQKGLAEYLKDIGLTCLIIPITTIAAGLALDNRNMSVRSA
ncbi:MAG TPA: hypothetical protein VFI11_15270 [Anaerolineales bacterium]|nr:hypothetical protein [Anaerolineales bacterium]